MEVNRHSNPECPETRKSLQGGEGDRRTRRSRQLLTEALTALIREKRYSRITVREIADRAGVGRSTFYAHFKDKEDLFLSGWQGLLDHFVQSIQWERLGRGRFAPVRELFEHVREFYDF